MQLNNFLPFLETFVKLLFIFILLYINNNEFKTMQARLYLSNINMLFGNSNISIIIETDSFDYKTFTEVWAPIITGINLELQSVYFYIHTPNKFTPNQINFRSNQTLKKNEEQKSELKKLANLSWPRIVISDFPDNGYLPLMISSYTDEINPLKIICYIDARNLDPTKDNYRKHIADLISDRPNNDRKHRLSEWIEKSYQLHTTDRSIGSIFGYKTKIQINSEFLPKIYTTGPQKKQEKGIIEKVVGCDIVMVKEPIVRELLYYTKSSMDSPSPFLALSLNNDLRIRNFYENLLSNEPIEKVDFFPFSKKNNNQTIQERPNKAFKCPYPMGSNKEDASYSVFIPCYKRNYFRSIFSMMNMQTLQPSYYLIVQNRFHVYLDYETELRYYFTMESSRPLYKVWMLNYNSFFILPNLVTSLLNTDFVVRLDDDHIPTNPNMMSHVVRYELLSNHHSDVILGDRASILNIYVGNFKERKKFEINCNGRHPDYVASPYIYRPIQMKLSGRLKPMFLAGGEDAHFGLSSAILCKTISKHISFNIRDLSGDGNGHEIDNEIIQYKQKYVHVQGELIHCVYEYYVRIGLKPVCWKKFELDPRDMINGSVYLHSRFF